MRRRLPIVDLIGWVIANQGLTDEVRKRCVCIYWPEIVGERIASKTIPMAFTAGTLQVAAINSPWLHELHFHKPQLIARTNAWVEANRTWLGPAPLVRDLRFVLATRQRDPLVDRDQLRRLRLQHARRVKPRPEVAPPTATDAEREAIRTETGTVTDAELRALIERVRVKWNR